MKHRKFNPGVVLTALIVILVLTVFTTDGSRGQSPNRPLAFIEAAKQNASLKNELSWTFGGKQQRGWYLYDLLIAETLKTRHDTVSSDFAGALAGWQQKMSLNPNGVLDENSLKALVTYWQSRRLNSHAYPHPDQLFTAPPSDFYETSRPAALRQVERSAYAAYKEMFAVASADLGLKPTEKYLKIISSFRTREYQEYLRRQSPGLNPAALAINSPHFTGRALDIYVGGSPVDTRDANRAIQVKTPAYRWLVRNAERFGFRPYFYEPWHWEYVK